MNIEKFKEIIKRREYVDEVSDAEWDEAIEECHKIEIQILAEDIQSTIDYFDNQCTESEYSWISEIIVDLAEKTHSKELIASYKKLLTKYPEESSKYYISDFIQSAEEILEEMNDD